MIGARSRCDVPDELLGDAADLAARPDRPVRPGRGGLRLEGYDEPALDPAARSAGRGLTAEQRPRRRVGARAGRGRLHRGAHLPVRRPDSELEAPRVPPRTTRAPDAASSWPTRSPTRRPPANHAVARSARAAAAQRRPRPAGRRPVRDRPGLPCGRAAGGRAHPPRPSVAGPPERGRVGRAGRLAAGPAAPCRRASWPGTRPGPAGGARAARLTGRTPSGPRATSPRLGVDRSRSAAAASAPVAPGPLRRLVVGEQSRLRR